MKVFIQSKNKQIGWYVKGVCDDLQNLMPENPRYARMVVRELSDRLLFGRRIVARFVIAATAALLAVGLDVLVIDRYLANNANPRVLARIAQTPTGEYRLFIIEHPLGDIYRIVVDKPISQQEADELMRADGWREKVIATEYRR